MPTTPHNDCSVARKTKTTPPERTLYLALELGWTSWKLAFTVGVAQAPRLRKIMARDVTALEHEITQAKARFKLPPTAPVVSCYEAGRDGFWVHRCLEQLGVRNLVVDSSSIEVNRRARRAKSDRLDAEKLLGMLLRHALGEKGMWRVVRVPSPAEEDSRQLHRELQALKTESTRHVNRIKGLLASCGLEVTIDKHFPKRLKELRQWNSVAVPTGLVERLLREFERMQVVNRQVRALERQRMQQLRTEQGPALDQVRRLAGLRGIGLNSSWQFVMEFFGWRDFANRRQVGSCAGLTPTPYASGRVDREQGISKAGNRRIRWMAVEIAWLWLWYQGASELSQWYHRRFGSGSSRQRRIGIVALARRLLVALWKYLKTGVPPAGAELCDWQSKLRIGTRALETV